MIGGKANSANQPTALGTLLQASTYGATIPNVYGMTKTPFLAIWAQNIRQGPPPGQKKFKAKKKGTMVYIENIDFLIGHNPIMGIMQAWSNATKLPLNFTSLATSVPAQFGTGSITITDPHFYAVVGATATYPFSETFNDYGSPGPVSVSGTFEIPLWNVFYTGPDPSNPSGYRNYPYVYSWNPAQGPTVLFPSNPTGELPFGVTSLNIYYAALSSALKYESPAAYLRLTFEPTLADGPEYGSTYAAQQVLMAAFAGAGSPNYDLGSSGAIPDNRPEVLGSYTVYSSGDADFADMIEDVVKSGVSQVSPAATDVSSVNTPIQRGASAYDYPGAVQKKASHSAFDIHAETFDYPVTEGNFLLAYWVGYENGGLVPTISDTLANSWNIVEAATQGGLGYSWIVAWCQVAASGLDTITIGNSSGFGGTLVVSELAGYDTFDSSSVLVISNDVISTSLTTTQPVGNPSSVFSFIVFTAGTGALTQLDPRWKDFATVDTDFNAAQWRTTWAPGAVFLNETLSSFGAGARVINVAFKAQNPLPYPLPFGNFIDDASMKICRSQARAYGLTGCLSMQTQKAARDWMKDLYSSMNCAPFYSGNLLKQMPYGEVSTAANGAIYIAPTSSGPIANLSVLTGGAYGDFLGDKDTPPVTVERTAQFDAPNILQYQILNRASDYNPVVVSQPEAGSVALYGVRKESPEVHNEISSADTARILLGIKCRRQAYIRNSVKFKLGPRGILYEPMDLITVTDPDNAMSSYPVRFTSVSVGTDWQATCESEPYIYGVHGPTAVAATDIGPYVPNPVADPGNVNTPIIFEPVPRLYSSQPQGELWAVVSAASPNYAGCYAYLSTDGGNSYNQVGTILGNGITGVSTGDWPIDTDPDTTNGLPLDLTESLGVLSSYMVADRDNFTYPCYIAGGNASIPYGLLSYNSVTMTAANKYTINATGTGNEIRRCVYGAPVPAPGPDVDHPNGSRFAFLGNPAQQNPPGLLKLTMDPKWIGVTLYLKFLPFNTFGNTVETLSSVTAYSFAPTGVPGSQPQPGPNNYSQNPAIDLTQPTGTTIHMGAVQTTFGTNTVNYNARTFTISNPSVPTVYYVTIADTGQVGDTGASTNLTATCQTSNALVGVPGNTYIGFIIAISGGGAGAIAAPGGNPQPASGIVTS